MLNRIKKPSDKWYSRAVWKNCRKLILHKQPICMICHRAPSVEVDHIVSHCGNWGLFLLESNLQALCHECHSAKTVRENRGFGNRPQQHGPLLSPTGSKKGNEWVASTVSSEQLNKALELPEGFLDGI